MNKVIRCFLDVDMRCQHDGLKKHALNRKVNIEKIKKNEHVIFVNKAINKVKIYSGNGVLSYYRSKTPLDLEAVAQIPNTFGNDIKTQYHSSIKMIFKKRVQKKKLSQSKTH